MREREGDVIGVAVAICRNTVTFSAYALDGDLMFVGGM